MGIVKKAHTDLFQKSSNPQSFGITGVAG